MENVRHIVTRNCTAALRNRRGAAAVEHALLAAMIALALVVVLTPLGRGLAREFSIISHTGGLSPAASPASPAGCHRVEWTGLDAKVVDSAAQGHAHQP